jgi:hypothetical protein
MIPRKLERYKWIGPKHWVVFAVGSRTYDLRHITDMQVDALLAEDEGYWGLKFRAKRKPAPRKKDDDLVMD